MKSIIGSSLVRTAIWYYYQDGNPITDQSYETIKAMGRSTKKEAGEHSTRIDRMLMGAVLIVQACGSPPEQQDE